MIYVEVNPADARERGLRDGATVEVFSRAGALNAQARLTQSVQPGHVFIPMHYADCNRLTLPAFDPYSRQPSYKATPVELRAASSQGGR